MGELLSSSGGCACRPSLPKPSRSTPTGKTSRRRKLLVNQPGPCLGLSVRTPFHGVWRTTVEPSEFVCSAIAEPSWGSSQDIGGIPLPTVAPVLSTVAGYWHSLRGPKPGLGAPGEHSLHGRSISHYQSEIATLTSLFYEWFRLGGLSGHCLRLTGLVHVRRSKAFGRLYFLRLEIG